MSVDLCLVDNYYIDKDYIEEFCEYYFELGIDKIWLLDDVNGKPNDMSNVPYVKTKIKEGKILHIKYFDHKNQHEIYSWFYNTFGDNFDWCCFFDCDEFLRLPKHNNIKDYLNDKELGFNKNCDVIQISWLMYGDNGYTHRPKGSVLRNFRCNPVLFDRIENKIIIKGGLTNVKTFIGHTASSNNRLDRIRYSNGSVVGKFDPFIENPDYSWAALDHFFCKSTEEFIERKSHGRIDAPNWTEEYVLNGFMKEYFRLSDKTEEKVGMFEYALKKLSRRN